MRALSVIAALLAAGCSLLTDFDRTYPGEADAAPTPDMGLDQREACGEGCFEVLDCAEELDDEREVVCGGLAFDENVRVFLGLCVEQCLQENDIPAPTTCTAGTARGFETKYGAAWTDLCDARASLCTALCAPRTGNTTALATCLMAAGTRPPTPVACSEACRRQDDALWLCLGEQRYLEPAGDQCAYLETCADFFTLEP